jgi:hypothetical protein
MRLTRWNGLWVAGLVLAGVLQSREARACEADFDCKGNRVCAAGHCVTPATLTPCSKDVDCSGDMVCESSHCIDPSAPPATPSDLDRPGARPTAPGTSEATPPPDVPMRPPLPTRQYPEYRFGIGVGGAILNALIGDTGSILKFGGSFEADAKVQLVENFALTMRVGGFISSDMPVLFIAPGFYLPAWKFGVNIGLGMAQNGGGNWLKGLWVVLPYDYPITDLFKIGVDLGIGIFPSLIEQSLSLHFGLTF